MALRNKNNQPKKRGPNFLSKEYTLGCEDEILLHEDQIKLFEEKYCTKEGNFLISEKKVYLHVKPLWYQNQIVKEVYTTSKGFGEIAIDIGNDIKQKMKQIKGDCIIFAFSSNQSVKEKECPLYDLPSALDNNKISQNIPLFFHAGVLGICRRKGKLFYFHYNPFKKAFATIPHNSFLAFPGKKIILISGRQGDDTFDCKERAYKFIDLVFRNPSYLYKYCK